MARKYHTLLICYPHENIPGAGNWQIHFGDYDKEVVKQELEDEHDSGTFKKNLKIITTGPKQADIDAAVAELNQNKYVPTMVTVGG